MLSSITNKFKSLISGFNSDKETVSRKRKNPFHDSPAEEREEPEGVKKAKVVEDSVFTPVFSSISSMSDWVQGKNFFSWKSDKSKVVSSNNGVRSKTDVTNGTHHRFANVNSTYMKGTWPSKGSSQSLQRAPFERQVLSKTVQTEKDWNDGFAARNRKSRFLANKDSEEPKFAASESFRLEDRMRYQQLLQKFTTVPLIPQQEPPTQKIRNPVRAPQLPRFYFKSNDSILGTMIQGDTQNTERSRDRGQEQPRIKVKSVVRSTPKRVIHQKSGMGGDADTSVLISDLSAINSVPSDGQPLHTIDLTSDSVQNNRIAPNDRLVPNERSMQNDRLAPNDRLVQNDRLMGSDRLSDVYASETSSQVSRDYHDPFRVPSQIHTKSWPHPVTKVCQNGFASSEDNSRSFLNEKHSSSPHPPPRLLQSRTIDLPEDEDVQITKVERIKPKDFRDSELQSDTWLKDLTSTYSKRERERHRKIAELEMRTKIHEEKKWNDSIDLELRIRDRLQIQRREPVFIKDVPDEPIELIEESEEEEEVEVLPELTEEMNKKIRYCLGGGNQGEILADKFRLQITRGDMATLSGLSWLNDEIINFYMNLLMERGETKGKAKVYAFNTFFYPKVMSGGQAAVKRWTKRVDVLAVDYILIPVHLQMHWCLAVINFKKKEIQYYDSMGGCNNECLNALRKYLNDESLDKKKKEFDSSGWKSIIVKDIPQQMNGSDCGMFACKYAEYITREAPITFTQKDMPYFRRRMVYEIHTCQLMQ